MKKYDLVLGWSSFFDRPFARKLRDKARKEGLSFYEITLPNFERNFESVQNGTIRTDVFIDRGFIDYPPYQSISELFLANGTRVINNPRSTAVLGSKLCLKEMYENAGLPLLPVHTINGQKNSSFLNKIISKTGIPFVVKTAHSADADSVVTAGQTAVDIRQFMQDYFDTVIVEPFISPTLIREKHAWFRAIFACGKTIPVWWNPRNHYYTEFGNSREEKSISSKLRSFAEKIHKMTGVELFTLEAVVPCSKGMLVITDYLNQPMDLNVQTENSSGLPPKVLDAIVDSIVGSIKKSV